MISISKLKDLIKFTFFLFLFSGTGFLIHSAIFSHLDPNASQEMIFFSYKFNIGITLLFTSSIILASEHLKEQLGFIYLISGVVKLGIFLFLIKTSSFNIDKGVFLHFFIPYVICVVLEIVYIVKILNEANFSEHN